VQRGWPGRLERPAVPQEPGAQVQRVPRTAARSETRPGDRTWLVQVVAELLRPKGLEHAQKVAVGKPDRERSVPGAAQVHADPPSIAAHGCRWREKPADSEAGQASGAALQAEAEPGMQAGEDEPRRACGGEEEAHDIQDVGRRIRGGGDAEEEPEAWLWCRQRQASRNISGDICAGVRVMTVTFATWETEQPVEATETVAPSQMGWDVPAAREEMLSTSGMSVGASEDAATQEGSWRLQGREPHYSRDADSGAEGRRQKLRTGLSHRVRVTGSDEPPGGA
jgi:hypothetical protein